MCRILIVDDEEAVLFAMTEYFTVRGFAVDASRDLREAETLLAANAYAAVITDLQLAEAGDTQGFDLIAFARTRWPDTRIVLMTAHESPQIETQARLLGADTSLRKPHSLPAIGQVVSDLLASRPTRCQREFPK